ncbi:zinc finger CCCH domain-containing protein 25-like [Zingiber officinale]|uniref:zinc finger CCCH domain-containing protein 25-like n=1 Tax=Zingiber officinale TaxID=94328 RepID=UPI001C4C36F8|nr:zinc finger CCCH domain-containing protein 25-like [Zingiber officinale]
MNPLTLAKRTQKINLTEAALGISDGASWQTKYKDSAYIFIGGIAFDLTEGDLLAVFAQYGEVVDVNLVRDKATGKSKGFAFLAYEDQRSTILAVDNLNGAKILGRIVRVDHVSNYKKKEEEEEDEQRQKKREARGVCRAFQRGECKWGDACKFSHDEQRCANTGWGAKDRESRWNHDKYDEPPKSRKNFSQRTSDHNEYHHKAREGDDEDIHHRKSERDNYSERWRLKGDHEEKRHRHERECSTHHRSREDEESQRRTRT